MRVSTNLSVAPHMHSRALSSYATHCSTEASTSWISGRGSVSTRTLQATPKSAEKKAVSTSSTSWGDFEKATQPPEQPHHTLHLVVHLDRARQHVRAGAAGAAAAAAAVGVVVVSAVDVVVAAVAGSVSALTTSADLLPPWAAPTGENRRCTT